MIHGRSMRMYNASRRRGGMLLAVMVMVGIALFITTGLLFSVQHDAMAASSARTAAQSRSLAISGTKVIMSELHRQRDDLLLGATPRLDSDYILFELGNEVGLVRLLPVGPSRGIIESEAGKLDINRIEAADLASTGLVDPTLAAAIVNHRQNVLRRPYQSIAELLEVPGMSAEILFGPVEDIRTMDDALFDGSDRGERLQRRFAGVEVRGLADVITVYSFEPALQNNGRLRINLNQAWSDGLGDQIAERFGRDAAAGVRGIMENDDFSLDSDAALAALLNQFDVPFESWVDAFDAFTMDGYEVHAGRLDINHAPFEALLGLPGMSEEKASAIVGEREGLSPDERSTIMWPAIEGILDGDDMVALAGKLTTRTWIWRVRLVAGILNLDDEESLLRNPVILDVVVDLSAPTPRLAYLRDITHLQTAATVAINASLYAEDDPIAELEAALAEAAAEFGFGTMEDDTANMGMGLGMDDESMFGSSGGGRGFGPTPPQTPRAPGPTQPQTPRAPGPTPPGQSSGSSGSSGSSSGSSAPASDDPNRPRPIGRWIGG